MSAATLKVELKLRDGQRQKICVQVQKNLSSLINGVSELNANTSQLLSELVEREKVHAVCARDEEEDSDEEEESCELRPPVKRSRT